MIVCKQGDPRWKTAVKSGKGTLSFAFEVKRSEITLKNFETSSVARYSPLFVPHNFYALYATRFFRRKKFWTFRKI